MVFFKKKTKILLAVEMDLLRRSPRISRKDKIPNNVITEKNGFTNFYFGQYKTK
jgi:hypothetical protein